MHDLWVFYYFLQKSIFTENYFLIAAINLAIWGPLYTCLVPVGFVTNHKYQLPHSVLASVPPFLLHPKFDKVVSPFCNKDFATLSLCQILRMWSFI